jgi:hypothetical protein
MLRDAGLLSEKEYRTYKLLFASMANFMCGADCRPFAHAPKDASELHRPLGRLS